MDVFVIARPGPAGGNDAMYAEERQQALTGHIKAMHERLHKLIEPHARKM